MRESGDAKKEVGAGRGLASLSSSSSSDDEKKVEKAEKKEIEKKDDKKEPGIGEKIKDAVTTAASRVI